MFIDTVPEISYSDPWILPLHERIKTLARGKRRIAYFYEAPNNSTFRYRAYNMVQVINDQDSREISASYFFLSDFDRIDEIADIAEILVICRSRYCNRINQLITKFRVRGKRVVFDIDDLVFDTKYAHLILNTLGQDNESDLVWDYWFSYISRMGETLRLCDAAITTNDYLAEKITAFSGLPVTVVPNFINKEQLNISEKLFHKKINSRFVRDEKICVGYFSGSPSHNLDYAIVVPALAEVMENNPQVELMVVGYIDQGPELKRFGTRVKRESFRDYVNLQRLIGSVEFNLMPLQINDFTNCKSDLKYFEAAIVGTLSIASPSVTYARAIKDGENGYLARAHQWAASIASSVNNLENYQEMATLAFNDALSNYAWFNQKSCIMNALGIP